MQIVECEPLPYLGIDNDKISIAAGGDHSLLRVEAKNLRSIRGCNGRKSLQLHLTFGNNLGENYRQSRLDSIMTAANSLDRLARELDILMGGPFVGGGGT